MAVEARHLNLFQPQLLTNNRDIVNHILEGDGNMYSAEMGYAVPLSGATATESLLPVYGSAIIDSLPPKVAAKADANLPCNIPPSRKRSRDSLNCLFASTPPLQSQKNPPSFSFLGEDLSLYVQQQQLEIELLVYQHMENVKLEMEEKRKRQVRRILEAIEVGLARRLKAKEEEIEKMGKLNWALEEKVKSLCVENQIWRDLAQANEATANALRSNLEQALAQVQAKEERTRGAAVDQAEAEDAQSCCGSSGNGSEEDREVEGPGARKLARSGVELEGERCDGGAVTNRWCRNCGKEESCVLLLPCRHLCLCTVCGSALHACPVCKSAKNASVHVNFS